MNIIQIQDRLKGLPEDALVNYVKNPMGEVPIYLALGEMQRRKDMKARFDASKPEEPSIAEKLVAETEPQQMGIAAMAPQGMMPENQGVGAPQPQQVVDPRQLAASGIAANPQSAVGGTAMMAEGGIVGYQEGGSTGYSDEFIKMLEDQAKGIYPTSDSEYGYNPSTRMQGYAGDAAGAMGKTYFGRNQFMPFGTGESMYSFSAKKRATIEDEKAKKELAELIRKEGLAMETDAQKKAREEAEEKYKLKRNLLGDGKKDDVITDLSADNKTNGKKVEDGKDTNLSADDKVRADLARIKSLFPEDADTIDLREKLADREDRALNMALIRGGLGMAAGQSANFLDNLAAGATSGVESYAKTQEGILKAQSEFAKQKRAEDLALLGKTLDMEQGTLDRESKERIAKDMSPTGQFNVGKAVLNIPAVKDAMKEIQNFKRIENPTQKEKDTLAKMEEELKILKVKLAKEIQSGFGGNTGQTSSNVVYSTNF